MYRIDDNYNWKTLEQWKYVVDIGNVAWEKYEETKVSDSVLEKALKLLADNCFPSAIVCCLMRDGKKVLLVTPLWEGIFSFLNNKRAVKIKGRMTYFDELKAIDKKVILNAEIFSIWVRNA